MRESDGIEVALDDLAEVHEGQPTPLVDHRIDGMDFAQHPHDFKLFLAQGVARQVALHRRRVFQEAGAVERPDGVLMGDPGRDHLAAPGVAGHDVRLHQAGRNAQVGFDEASIKLYRCSPAVRLAEIDVGSVVAREVVLDPDIAHDPVIAHHLPQLGTFVRSVQPRCDQHGNVLPRDSSAKDFTN